MVKVWGLMFALVAVIAFTLAISASVWADEPARDITQRILLCSVILNAGFWWGVLSKWEDSND